MALSSMLVGAAQPGKPDSQCVANSSGTRTTGGKDILDRRALKTR